MVAKLLVQFSSFACVFHFGLRCFFFVALGCTWFIFLFVHDRISTIVERVSNVKFLAKKFIVITNVIC